MPYTPHTEAEIDAMLRLLGHDSVDDLFTEIPEPVRQTEPLDLPDGLSELEVRRLLRGLAAENRSTGDLACFLGAGAYDHHVPSVVDHMISRGEFFTAYTPYQAEVSQGTLQATYEFQSMICSLTGMEAANASLYDGASALAEAALMSLSLHRGRRHRVLVSEGIHPEYRQTVRTYVEALDRTVESVPLKNGVTDREALAAALDDDAACLLLQNPNFFGLIEDGEAVASALGESDSHLIVSADPISLGLLRPPGAYGAEIVVGEGQALGNPLQFGGPYFGFFAARKKDVRKMPGRIIGQSKDADGRRGYVMTLQTREQHIRRERATSNICTNQALNSLAAAVYMTAVGPDGLREAAEQSLRKTRFLADRLAALPGVELRFPGGSHFKEVVVELPVNAGDFVLEMLDHGLLAGLPLTRLLDGESEGALLVCVTEKRSRTELDRYVDAAAAVLGGDRS